MKLVIALLLISVSAPAAFSQALTVCPWFTTGSAARVLGGEVTLVAHASGNWDGSCTFERRSEKITQTIAIQVSKTDSHPCPAGSTILKALANEAVECSRANGRSHQEDTIAGRVRDVYFVVTMTNVPGALRDPDANARPSDPFGAYPLERVSEQVAGNLF